MRKRGIDRQAEDYIITEISGLVMDLGPAMQELFERAPSETSRSAEMEHSRTNLCPVAKALEKNVRLSC